MELRCESSPVTAATAATAATSGVRRLRDDGDGVSLASDRQLSFPAAVLDDASWDAMNESTFLNPILN
jgi:hypothetical protein